MERADERLEKYHKEKVKGDSLTQEEKIKNITEKLEKGIKELFESDRYTTFLKVMSKFHNYSFNNSLLIAMQCPEATMVAGYTSWKRNFHRNVNKGEKGIKILAPCPYKINKEVDKIDPLTQKTMVDKDGNVVKERVQVTIPAYKVTTVFDISQTSGKEIPRISTELQGDVNGYKNFFEAICKVSHVPIEFEKMRNNSNGYYHLTDKKIAIREGMSQMQTVKTALHELSHAKLHDKNVGIEKDNLPDVRTKEVEAESVAYTVCQHYGIDTSDYSFGYIVGWSSGKKLEELKSSMNIIRTTASEIIKGIDKEISFMQEKEMITQLAIEIDSLAADVNHAEKNIEEIKADLLQGNVKYIQEWIKPILEKKESQEKYQKAVKINKKLKEFSEEKSEKMAMEEVFNKIEKRETVRRKHHRSHR